MISLTAGNEDRLKDLTIKYFDIFKHFVTKHVITILFLVLSIVFFLVSGMGGQLYALDIVNRVSRNLFLVLALIIPVTAGMGLNFSIILGAMSSQAVIIFVTHWGHSTGHWLFLDHWGILTCAILATPLAILVGYAVGNLFNRTKGQEMITGIILGFFAAAIYMFVFLQLVGGFIPMDNEILVLSSGVGIRTTIDLSGYLRYGLDDLWRVSLPVMIVAFGVLLALFRVVTFIRAKTDRVSLAQFTYSMVLALIAIGVGIYHVATDSVYMTVGVPAATWLAIIALCVFITFFQRTKLGQDMRAAGQDRHVAAISGIAVDKVRVKAVIYSTVLAAWGHIIFLQNMGAFSTYGSYNQIGFYSVAAILIGGATVTKANIGHAILGVFLFHTLFIFAPSAGRQLFGDAQIGEYFRVFVVYGVIGFTLALYAWKTKMQGKQLLQKK